MSLFPNELPHLTHRGMAEKVLEWFETHRQLQTPGANRLFTQCRLIVKTKGIVQNDDRNWHTIVQSLKDVQEYWFIIQILGAKLLQSPFLDAFMRSLDDSTHPMDSGKLTPGRNAQFELYVGAIAARAGLTVDRLVAAGADWIMTSPSRRWSLEAKRIKNLNSLEKHIRKAAKQIAASKVGGLIAVDISLATNPEGSPLSRFVPDSGIIKAHKDRTNALGKKWQEPIVKWIGSASVGFVLLHESVIIPAQSSGAGHEPWGLTGLWSKVDVIASDSSNRQYYDDLWHLFQAALPNF